MAAIIGERSFYAGQIWKELTEAEKGFFERIKADQEISIINLTSKV